jgi:hypothetical protein
LYVLPCILTRHLRYMYCLAYIYTPSLLTYLCIHPTSMYYLAYICTPCLLTHAYTGTSLLIYPTWHTYTGTLLIYASWHTNTQPPPCLYIRPGVQTHALLTLYILPGIPTHAHPYTHTPAAGIPRIYVLPCIHTCGRHNWNLYITRHTHRQTHTTPACSMLHVMPTMPSLTTDNIYYPAHAHTSMTHTLIPANI